MGLVVVPALASAANGTSSPPPNVTIPGPSNVTIPGPPNVTTPSDGPSDDGWSRAQTDIVLYGMLRAAYILLHGIFCLAPMRRRVQAWLGSSCLPLCGNDEVSSLTTVGGLLGPGHEPAAALRLARDRFRAVPADGITHARMLRARHDGSQLPLTALAWPTPLGACDAFISHAWLDCPGRRFEALARWHSTFRQVHQRRALVWLDQFCIDASSVRADLACIGSFIAGCRQFVLLASPSYATRLWCVLELVTFLEMGGKISDVLVVPLVPPRAPPAHRAKPVHELNSSEAPCNEANCPLRAWIAQQRTQRLMASVASVAVVGDPRPVMAQAEAVDAAERPDAASHLPSSCDVAPASAVDIEMAMDAQPMPRPSRAAPGVLPGGKPPPSAPPSPSALPATPIGLSGPVQGGDLPHAARPIDESFRGGRLIDDSFMGGRPIDESFRGGRPIDESFRGGRSEDYRPPTASPRAYTPSGDELRAAFYAAIEPLTRFDVQRSRCHDPNDVYALLAFIESAFGSHHCE